MSAPTFDECGRDFLRLAAICGGRVPPNNEIGLEGSATKCMSVPLVTGSGPRIGALCVADKRAGEFVPNDQRVLVHLADLAAVGLETARLYAYLEARVRRRTQQLQDSSRELEALSY